MRVAVIQIEIDIVARTSASTASSSSTAVRASEGHEGGTFAKVMDQPHGNLITVLSERSNKVEILSRSGKVRQGDEGHQRFCRRIDIRDHISRNLLLRAGIYELRGK